MVRIKRANGKWDELPTERPAPQPFQRADGTTLSQNEIAEVARVRSQDELYKTGYPVVRPPKPSGAAPEQGGA